MIEKRKKKILTTARDFWGFLVRRNIFFSASRKLSIFSETTHLYGIFRVQQMAKLDNTIHFYGFYDGGIFIDYLRRTFSVNDRRKFAL